MRQPKYDPSIQAVKRNSRVKYSMQQRHLRRIEVVAIALLCVLPGCSPSITTPAPKSVPIRAEVDAEIDTLLGLVRNRLVLMHDVARWKWHEGLPITDLEREEVVIKRAVQLAEENGLDTELAEKFMAAQIDAGKQIQQKDFAAWKASGAMDQTPSPDLAKELRPKIDRLSVALVASLARLAPHLDDSRVLRILQERGAELSRDADLDAEAWSKAMGPILGI
jgi:chorismate mutase